MLDNNRPSKSFLSILVHQKHSHNEEKVRCFVVVFDKVVHPGVHYVLHFVKHPLLLLLDDAGYANYAVPKTTR
jgi:hypothetical protein